MDFSKPVPDEMKALLRQAASEDFNKACAAMAQVAKAIETPIKKGAIKGDTLAGVYQIYQFDPGVAAHFPTDLFVPGTEHEYIAYVLPNTGSIPQKHVESDFVNVQCFEIGCSLDTHKKYIRDARWDIVGRMMQIIEGMMVRKKNDDGWHTLLAAGKNRGIQTVDSAATAGLFTKKVVAEAKTVMRRGGGGNNTSQMSGRLTDLWISPESSEDMYSWDLSQIDDVTRREIFVGADTSDEILPIVAGVRIHILDELGVSQLYQLYYTDTLGGSMSGSKLEIGVGLDLLNRDSFVRVAREPMQVVEDIFLARQRRVGWIATEETGWAVLDTRRVMLIGI